jgi:drug/metabolite transporter (DMT)-like permease
VKNSTKGLLALSVASAIWGGMYVASDALMRNVPPMIVLELRELISAVVLLPLAYRSGGLRAISKADVIQLVGAGVVGFSLSVGFQFYGTHLAGAALGSLITASSPVAIAVLGATVLKEQIPLRRWLAMALALVGVVVIVGSPVGGAQVKLGIFYLLVATLAWATYTVLSTSLLRRHSALVVVSVASLVGALTSAPFAAYSTLNSPRPFPVGIVAWLLVGYISVIGMALAFFMWSWGFNHVSASRGGVMLLFQPVVGVILGALILGERVSPETVLGGLLVAVGVILAVRSTSSELSHPTETLEVRPARRSG